MLVQDSLSDVIVTRLHEYVELKPFCNKIDEYVRPTADEAPSPPEPSSTTTPAPPAVQQSVITTSTVATPKAPRMRPNVMVSTIFAPAPFSVRVAAVGVLLGNDYVSRFLPISALTGTKWAFNHMDATENLLWRKDGVWRFREDVAMLCLVRMLADKMKMSIPVPNTYTTSYADAVRKVALLREGDERYANPTDDALRMHVCSADWALVYAQTCSASEADRAVPDVWVRIGGQIRRRVTGKLVVSAKGLKVQSGYIVDLAGTKRANENEKKADTNEHK